MITDRLGYEEYEDDDIDEHSMREKGRDRTKIRPFFSNTYLEVINNDWSGSPRKVKRKFKRRK